jgi:hypothetical protein
MDGYAPWGKDETWQELADHQLDHDPTPGQQAQHEALSEEHTCVTEREVTEETEDQPSSEGT